ncbi:MAG: hypothetical protein ACC645_27780 [Pirellulales bacterium]
MHVHHVDRWFLAAISLSLLLVDLPRMATAGDRIAVIDITDLYHPHQDPGDNLDLIAAYGLPEIDLRGVVLDVTDPFRGRETRDAKGKLLDNTGPREPGFVPVWQLNYVFDRNVPMGVGPFRRMRSPTDHMPALPAFQQSGIDLIFRLLEESAEKFEIVSFGSARPLAVAYRRNPSLLRRKVRRIHLCAGATDAELIEWNVRLDPNAMVSLLRSDLPIAVYPCATDSPFHYGPHNTFWRLPDLTFIRRMDPRLQSYLAFAFTRSSRPDFLRAMDQRPKENDLAAICRRPHKVWETAVWMAVARRKLVQRAGGTFRIVPEDEVAAGDTVLPGQLRPCTIDVQDDGRFTFAITTEPTNFLIYDRGDAKANESALRVALPALYRSFRPPKQE